MSNSVLLFIENAEGQLKGGWIATRFNRGYSRDEFRGYYFSRKVLRFHLGFARCWWLVECENAAAGREIIKQYRRASFGAPSYETGNLGRILDSGKNEVAA